MRARPAAGQLGQGRGRRGSRWGWGPEPRVGSLQEGHSGGTAVTLPSLGRRGLKRLTGDGLKARGYVMESQSFQCKLQLLLLLPLMPVTHVGGWARNPERRSFLMLTVVGSWKSERKEEGGLWRSGPATRLSRGGGA